MSRTLALSGLEGAELGAEYERRGLAELSDAQLVGLGAQLLSAPLDSELPASSFVLHAPLELLARARLLPQVDPRRRRAARLRLLSLVAGYEQAGEPLAQPRGERGLGLGLGQACAELRGAIGRGELEEVDALAPQIASRASAEEIGQALAESVVDALGAAGHANIFLDLARGPVAGASPGLLWPLARELAKAPGRAMTGVLAVRAGGAALEVAHALARLEPIGPSGAFGIAAMVEHAEARGAIAQLLEEVGPAMADAPSATGRQLLRCAAQTMLQGPPDQAPYGWTHSLTLPQAALAQAQHLDDPTRAVAVAAAYVAAHWVSLASERFDPGWQPERAPSQAPDAREPAREPSAAAAAVWWCPPERLAVVEQALATRASLAHDAHHVKYTLACLRAAAADPAARRLFLAAAAYLGAWWAAHPDAADPLPDAEQAALVEA